MTGDKMYANDFNEILATVATNNQLRVAVEGLIDNEPMPGKVTEGGDRLDRFRAILRELVNGRIGLQDAYIRAESDLPREASPYAANNRVFPDNWGERLVRTQLVQLSTWPYHQRTYSFERRRTQLSTRRNVLGSGLNVGERHQRQSYLRQRKSLHR